MLGGGVHHIDMFYSPPPFFESISPPRLIWCSENTWGGEHIFRNNLTWCATQINEHSCLSACRALKKMSDSTTAYMVANSARKKTKRFMPEMRRLFPSGNIIHNFCPCLAYMYAICIRAGELPKNFCQVVQTWHMGLKNVSKKFGTPGPNLAPTHFGLFGQGQITKASTPKWVCRTLKICLFYNFHI